MNRLPALLRASLLASLLTFALFVATSSAASAHHKPCHPKSLCEVPEVPWTLLLPAATFGSAGAFYVINRVRGGRSYDDADE